MNKNPAFAVSFQQHDLISFEKKGNHDIQCIYNSICHFVYHGQCVKTKQKTLNIHKIFKTKASPFSLSVLTDFPEAPL